MRPAGGFTPDMYNYAYDTDVYKLWADMIAYNGSSKPVYLKRQYCAFLGRRDNKDYVLNHQAMIDKYGHCMKMNGRIPDALSACMANQMYVCLFDDFDQMQAFYRESLACKG